jgi:hypothetical protein
MIENIFPILYHKGLLHAVCDTDAWTQPLELLYYLNYLVKYWELIDTVFLVLKKKKLGKWERKDGTYRDKVAWILIITLPIEFLHYYHHSLTMVLCYTQLGGQTSVVSIEKGNGGAYAIDHHVRFTHVTNPLSLSLSL